MNVTAFLERLEDVRDSGDGWSARCPAHDGTAYRLSVSEGSDGRILLHCRAGCNAASIVRRLGLALSDLFPSNPDRGEGTSFPSRNTATLQHSTPAGCTVAAYAESKRLPLNFLRRVCYLSDVTYMDAPAMRIPYLKPDGTDGPVRFRIALEKGEHDDRFRWKKGGKAMLYGLWRLPLARDLGAVVLVEGESDCHTLWYHDVPAIGLPGAGTWHESRDAGHFDGIPTIYVVIEPDAGGDGVLKWLATSSIRDRVRLVTLGGLVR